MLQRVVLILGMHRSGTSLTAQALGRLGLPLGSGVLTAPQPDNETGYWEHREVVLLHERLLARLDRIWHSPKGALPMPAGWLDTPDAEAARTALGTIVARELARGNGVWGVKDPRLMRLLPLWLPVLERLGAEPVVVLAVRHPAEVAASLARRNRMPTELAQLQWLVGTLEALSHAGPHLRAVVPYERWFSDPDGMAAALSARLDLPAPVPGMLAPLVRADLRHHREVPAFRPLPHVEDLFALLAAGALAPPPARGALDAMTRAVAEGGALFAPLAEMLEAPPAGAPGILRAGVAAGIPTADEIRAGRHTATTVPADAPVLFLWALMRCAGPDDAAKLRLRDPGGHPVVTWEQPVGAGPGILLVRAGAERPSHGWTPGRWWSEWTLSSPASGEHASVGRWVTVAGRGA